MKRRPNKKWILANVNLVMKYDRECKAEEGLKQQHATRLT